MNRENSTHVWECIELSFRAEMNYENPFRDVELQVEFSCLSEKTLLVPGFWDGADLWKVRFAPVADGEWSWRSSCSNPKDNGLHSNVGLITALPWSVKEIAENPNRRGFIRVHEQGRYFEYADGTPFYWLGDTLWAAHTSRCDLENTLPKYLLDRKEKGFSVIQMVAGHPEADEDNHEYGSYVSYSPKYFLNEGGAPYLKRYDLINPQYFQFLDQRIRLMTDMGFVPCIMGMWGQELKGMSVQITKEYLCYIIARYAAFNVSWSPAGEYLFTWDVQAWRELGEVMKSYDPYKHPTSVHSVAPHSGSQHYHKEAWYDFNLIQVGHVLAFKNFMEMLPYIDYHLQPAKPAIMSESWYENHPNRLMDDGKWIQDQDIRFAAYVSLLQGCVGQTYGAHGIWSLFNGDESDKWRDDERPDMWYHDLELPGSMQMKHLRTLMETLEWWRLVPYPEGVTTLKENSIYCSAISGKQYVIYITGGNSPAPVMVMVVEGEGKHFAGQWFNPRSGEWSKAAGDYTPYGCGWMWRSVTPDQQDWVLTLVN
ncbi:DUF4038 domain-containing protein [Paenibacillus psychroresistens]|uniref:DUF4038 domain-containing protein n=1 Tax=Paenibacillus psychroresistens TaxID=1778678 RepID=A0A6B8RH00_9BACL|nr:DUF4038 domain-containing protein [Paenibacillus psychroresistens]QGQ95004.1 DUF4038 domain-containing protein [Paenibacillus psychroresistens]